MRHRKTSPFNDLDPGSRKFDEWVTKNHMMLPNDLLDQFGILIQNRKQVYESCCVTESYAALNNSSSILLLLLLPAVKVPLHQTAAAYFTQQQQQHTSSTSSSGSQSATAPNLVAETPPINACFATKKRKLQFRDL